MIQSSILMNYTLATALKKITKQIGKNNYKRDVKRIAQPAGRRISKTGRLYYETRKNRTDRLGELI